MADNENRRLLTGNWTPASFLAWLHSTRAEMRRELVADFSLRYCPEHRWVWDQLDAMERCFQWHYGDRSNR